MQAHNRTPGIVPGEGLAVGSKTFASNCFVFLLKQNHSQFSSSLFGLLLYLNHFKIFFSFWAMAFLAVLCFPFLCSLPVVSGACLYESVCCGRCSFIIYAFPLWMAFA